jgi:hypothetical protein
MCSDAPPPPDFTPLANAMREVGDKMAALGQQQLAFGQQRYQETMPLYQQLVASNLQGQNLAMEMAKDAAKERLKYRALEDSLVEEAQRTSAMERGDIFAGRAAADVEQSLAQQRGAAMRNLTRMGVNPNAARFAALNNEFALRGAAATAGAKTAGRLAGEQYATGLRYNAAAMGRGLPAQQLSAIGTGANVGSATGALVQQQNAPMYAGFQGAMGGLQGQMGGIQGAGSLMNMGYQNQLAYSQANSGLAGALGQLGGMALGYFMPGAADGGKVENVVKDAMDKNEYGDGGKISGPGTGTSDSVQAINTSDNTPIRLSNGEYIIPADVVREKGKEFFDKLLDKHHTPVRKSRRRNALRKG